MKLYTRLRNEKGKEVGIAGNEWIDIDIMVGNNLLAEFTLRHCDTMSDLDISAQCESGWVLYDNNDTALYWQYDKKKPTGICAACGNDTDDR